MTVIDSVVLERHGIKPDEYDRILQLMGREPNLLELGLFSVMWSEHCSYKSSRVHLKTLPTAGPRVVQGPGENAGAADRAAERAALRLARHRARPQDFRGCGRRRRRLRQQHRHSHGRRRDRL
jgi:phosphoribosylformylglycinamidine (FGAM) synthase-like enzyme